MMFLLFRKDINCMKPYGNDFSIKGWAEEDRPREKLLLKGKNALSDAELLAILIGSGNREDSAVDLCKKILNTHQNNLNELAKTSLSELQNFKGIGEAKAISIIAALEIGKRRLSQQVVKKKKLESSKDAYHLLYENLGDLPHEEFWVLYLNRRNELIRKVKVGHGGVNGTVADVRIILKKGIELLASGMIIAHNHPSGNLKPSHADIKLTRKIRDAGKLIDIHLLDHVIVGFQSYFSFGDEGML